MIFRCTIYFIVICIITLFWLHNVESEITKQDILAINKIAEISELQIVRNAMVNATFEEQIAFVNKLTVAINSMIDPSGMLIPSGVSREPQAWLKARSPLCYDVARVMEKILGYAGFEVRYMSVFELEAFSVTSAWQAIIKPRVASHAMIEIKTHQGWLALDTWYLTNLNSTKVYISKENIPIQTADIGKYLRNGELKIAHVIFNNPILIVYGLYSRHGGAYPPYDRIPDLSWSQFIFNGCCKVVTQ